MTTSISGNRTDFTLSAIQNHLYMAGVEAATRDQFGYHSPNAQDQVGSRGKYYPYGEDKGSSPLPNEQYKYATYWRDAESGLDCASNRYYSSTWGAFLRAD